MSRGQSMSFDAIAATFMFILIAVFGAVYAFNFFAADLSETLQTEANTVSEYLLRDLSVEQEGTGQLAIDEDRFLEYVKRNEDGYYSTIKSEFGVSKEFCVFLEDENGDLVLLVTGDEGTGTFTAGRAAFGSEDVVFVNGTDQVSCG